MKWEPADIIRLIALVGGFLLCGLGAYMMWLGVGAEGVVDIRSSVLSGTVKTASAGLFIIFFGFAIIVFVLATLGAKSSMTGASAAQRQSRTRTLAWAFWAILASFLVTASLGALGHGAGFGPAAFFLGFMLIAVGAAYVALLESE
jgi:hypothetical protein